MKSTLKNKATIIQVKRLKKGVMRYFENSISTDGATFIKIKCGDFEWQLNKSMTKEFYRKLKKLQAL